MSEVSKKRGSGWVKPVVFLVVIAVVAIGALLGLDFALSHGMCRNAVVAEAVSPGGRLRAVVYERACGEGGANTHVSILGAGQALPDRDGNVFVTSGTLAVAVRWGSDYELVIGGRTRLDLTRLGEHKGVRIIYE